MADFQKVLEDELLAAIDARQRRWRARKPSAVGRRAERKDDLRDPETLGTMKPEERKQTRPLNHGMRDRVSEAIAQKKRPLNAAATAERLEPTRSM